jgi:hypothetical protein
MEVKHFLPLPRKDLVSLRDTLKGIKGKFITCYLDHPLVRRLYEGFKNPPCREGQLLPHQPPRHKAEG